MMNFNFSKIIVVIWLSIISILYTGCIINKKYHNSMGDNSAPVFSEINDANLSLDSQEPQYVFKNKNEENYYNINENTTSYQNLIYLLETSKEKLYQIYFLDKINDLPEIGLAENAFSVKTPINNLEIVFPIDSYCENNHTEINNRTPPMAIRYRGAVDLGVYSKIENDELVSVSGLIEKGDSFQEIFSWFQYGDGGPVVKHFPIEYSGYFESDTCKTYIYRLYISNYIFEFCSGSLGKPAYEELHIRRSSKMFSSEYVNETAWNLPKQLDASDCTLEDFKLVLLSSKDKIEKEYYIVRSFMPTTKETCIGKLSSNIPKGEDTEWPFVPIDNIDVLYAENVNWKENLSPVCLYINRGNILEVGVAWSFSEIETVWGAPLYEGVHSNAQTGNQYSYIIYEREGLYFVFAGTLKTAENSPIGDDVYIFLESNQEISSLLTSK